MSNRPSPAEDRNPAVRRYVEPAQDATIFAGEVAGDGKTPIVVHRVPLMSLKPGDLNDPQRIPDTALRDALYGATRGRWGKDFVRTGIRV